MEIVSLTVPPVIIKVSVPLPPLMVSFCRKLAKVLVMMSFPYSASMISCWAVVVKLSLSLTSVTPIVNCFSKDNPPWSVVLTRTL
jgi:hypothetical protein